MPRPETAEALSGRGGSPSAAVEGVAGRIAALFAAADPASGAPVPAGLARRAAALVRDGGAAAAPAATLLPRDADLLDAWLADGANGPPPAGLAGLDALLAGAAASLGAEGVPAGLAPRTLERLAAQRRAEALAAQIDRFRGPNGPEADAASVAGRIGFGRSLRSGFRQVLSAAAVLLIGSALLLPVLRQSSVEAGRLACMNNLRAAGGAFAQYAADFGGVMPRAAGFSGAPLAGLLPSAASAADTAGPADLPPRFSGGNAQHLALLATRGGGYLPVERLICNGQPGEAAAAAGRFAWRMAGAAAYSYQSQAGPRPLRLDDARSDLGVLADRNPLFVLRAGRLVPVAGRPEMTPSRLHRGEGQNVLTAAGDARWTVRPSLGVPVLPGRSPAWDHLWAPESASADSRTTPVDIAQDAVLVP
ncbi:hypothetical protein [Phycisphaera mikurensis]|uniref:hypothetical protein n=1 Tax=Phycisphaera mikurensis TaxID=547188 RepID=UPI0012B61734|nr:hypothetical protein [Phycisphaera mikurensis]MBB6443008.1 hypothetical protein [Phycisphaera mikurensis]